MKIYQWLLKPRPQQPSSLRSFALIKKSYQGRVSSRRPLYLDYEYTIPEHEKQTHDISRGFGEIQGSQRASVKFHVLRKVMRTNGVRGMI